jgi:hypothetical protein
MMAANYFLKHITKLHPGWRGGGCTEGRASNVIKNVVFSAKQKELVKHVKKL